MKNAILIPGRPDREEYYDPQAPTNSNNHWFPWLTKQLMLKDILTVAVEMPEPYRPRYAGWLREFERFDITPETILVGHSCGGGFLLRYLSEHPDVRVGKVVLVAPWTNSDNDPAGDTADFFEYELDPNLAAHTQGLVVMVSDDDQAVVRQTVSIIRSTVTGATIRQFTSKGHFTTRSLGGEAAPDILAEILPAS